MRPSGPRIERLIVEARARITWGDSPAQVREWLIAEKIYDFEADEILRELTAERSASMRKRGLGNVAVGTGAIALSLILGFAPWLLETQGIEIRSRIFGLLMAGCGVSGIYGANQLFNGIERLVRGAAAEGADSDVTE